MSDQNYIKNARKNSAKSDSSETEASLILNNVEVETLFRELQTLKMEIAEKKVAAIEAIDLEYKDRIADLEAQYAIQIAFVRG